MGKLIPSLLFLLIKLRILLVLATSDLLHSFFDILFVKNSLLLFFFMVEIFKMEEGLGWLLLVLVILLKKIDAPPLNMCLLFGTFQTGNLFLSPLLENKLPPV